jgi:hypothetical protein
MVPVVSGDLVVRTDTVRASVVTQMGDPDGNPTGGERAPLRHAGRRWRRQSTRPQPEMLIYMCPLVTLPRGAVNLTQRAGGRLRA